MSEITTTYPSIIDRRLVQIRFVIEEMKAECIMLTNISNIRYLTNFSGSNAQMFIFKDKIHFITDDRYELNLENLYKLPNMEIHISRDVWKLAEEKGITKGVDAIGFEADTMPYSEAVLIRNIIRPIKFKPTELDIDRFMIPKDVTELDSIKSSIEIAEKSYKDALKFIKVGMSEKEIADQLVYSLRKNGSEGEPFDVIVTSGSRTSLVHALPSDRKIKKNELVLLDFGAKVNGFCSDITRVISTGKATKDQKAIYSTLKSAQKVAADMGRPGTRGKLMDEAAREVITKAGYGQYFKHGLGHGIGLAVHEAPFITIRKEDQLLSEDCVISIEPGIYLPEKFGIRIEDMFHVTRNGVIQLSKAPEEMDTI